MAEIMFQNKIRDIEEIVFHYKNSIRNYATFSGRLSGRGFWYFFGAINIIVIVSLAVDSMLRTDIFLNLAVLFHIIPYFSALVRRLHDAGYSTWVVIPCIVPLIALIFALMASEKGPNEYGSPPVPFSPRARQNPNPMLQPKQPLQAHARNGDSKSGEPPIEKLERLAELRNKGAITDAEFEEMKRRLLGANPV
ncbi:DUF805 domain-containing protein [Mesorhizobium sp. CA15]|uniref:DUF805 domain-containing protein n=1 Tax=Mesorhizobium sp. CA15 TaxID=2876641 RepID=UPI001CD10EEF|nr:DUF805 domain-containing protein [Mesorhizobium sp. CA15]MBZ9864239.1 DUF805 domain-containing protein [Mesorhizobium sp. CA15]